MVKGKRKLRSYRNQQHQLRQGYSEIFTHCINIKNNATSTLFNFSQETEKVFFLSAKQRNKKFMGGKNFWSLKLIINDATLALFNFSQKTEKFFYMLSERW